MSYEDAVTLFYHRSYVPSGLARISKLLFLASTLSHFDDGVPAYRAGCYPIHGLCYKPNGGVSTSPKSASEFLMGQSHEGRAAVGAVIRCLTREEILNQPSPFGVAQGLTRFDCRLTGYGS